MAVPEVVILRLPLYMRALSRLVEEKAEVVSSQELGSRLQLNQAQIRKDLSYFGRQSRGYNVRRVTAELRRILQLDQGWPMALTLRQSWTMHLWLPGCPKMCACGSLTRSLPSKA